MWQHCTRCENRVVLLIFSSIFTVAAAARCSAAARSARSTFFCDVACSSDNARASVRTNFLHSATGSPCREHWQCLDVRVDARHRDASGGHLRARHRLPTCCECGDCFTTLRVHRDTIALRVVDSVSCASHVACDACARATASRSSLTAWACSMDRRAAMLRSDSRACVATLAAMTPARRFLTRVTRSAAS